MAGWLRRMFGGAKAPPAPHTRAEANQAVRAVLADSGDNGTARRQVVHYAYPRKGGNLGSATKITELMELRGYRVRAAAADGGLILEHSVSVAGADFDTEVRIIEQQMDALGWEYDGWEAAVAK